MPAVTDALPAALPVALPAAGNATGNAVDTPDGEHPGMPRSAAATLVTRVVGTVSLLGLLVAGCTADRSTSPPPAGPTTPAATPAELVGVDETDPAAVCEGFARVLYSRDTVTDAGPGDAYRRAAAFLEPSLAAAAMSGPDRSAEWEQWRGHQVRTDVQVTPWLGDGQPEAAGSEQYRAVVATVLPVGADGWRGPARTTTVYCTLTPSAPPRWRISAYELVGDGTAHR